MAVRFLPLHFSLFASGSNGERASLFAASLQSSLLNWNRQDLDFLCLAVRDYTRGCEGPATALAFWDADPLDLG